MIVDALLALHGSITGNTVTGAALNGNGTTVLSANSVDLLQARDMGEGSALYGRVEVTTAYNGTSAEFQVVAADDAAGTNPTVIGTSGAILAAALTIGARFAFRINPRLASKSQQFITGRVVNTGNNAAGAVYMDIGLEIQDGQKFYPSGFAVL